MTFDLDELTISADPDLLADFLKEVGSPALAERSAASLQKVASESGLPVTIRNMRTGKQFHLNGGIR